MQALPQRVFDFFALSRKHGLAFPKRQPIAAYCSDDGLAFGALTRCDRSGFFGVECMRRRADQVWASTRRDTCLLPYIDAMKVLGHYLQSGVPPLPIPSGVLVRAPLFRLGKKGACDAFKLLSSPSHHPAAWALNQVYLAFPRPDKNWAGDCQTGNFHTRLWEAYLLACFREQGCIVEQDLPSPDFRIGRRGGLEAWIEAVTANDVPYSHVSRSPRPWEFEPTDVIERQTGKAAVRFAKTIRSKMQKNYADMDHVRGKPFAIAIADFHAHGSMMWTREALMAYLYGAYGTVEERDGERVGAMKSISELMGDEKIPAGLFRSPESAKLSAIVFSNAATIAKFNRMGFLAGVRPPSIRMVRAGAIFDRRPGALEPIPFLLDIASEEYAALWPGIGESWSLELEVFHNPLAATPFPLDLLPECTHWFVDQDGDVGARARYEHSILSSHTQILEDDLP
jgi:hypothetical protein